MLAARFSNQAKCQGNSARRVPPSNSLALRTPPLHVLHEGSMSMPSGGEAAGELRTETTEMPNGSVLLHAQARVARIAICKQGSPPVAPFASLVGSIGASYD